MLAAGALNTRVTDDERPADDARPEARDLFGGSPAGRRLPHRAFEPTLTFEADRRLAGRDTTQPDELILDHGDGYFDPVNGIAARPLACSA